MKYKILVKALLLAILSNTSLVFAQNKEVVSEKGYKVSKLEKMDTNKDSKISKDEFMFSANSEFEKIDINKDGFITIEELRIHRSLKEEIRSFNQKRFEKKE
jgi:hypothetical protein